MKQHVDPYRVSLYATIGGVEHKSCPKCSRNEQRLVMYPVTDFGERQITPGEHIPQSWCPACRGASEKVGA